MFEKKKGNILFFVLLFIPAILVFRSFFLKTSLVWGDAPFFYEEGLVELLKEPSVWTNRGTDLGGINYLLWLSPLMYIYGLLNKLFGFGNETIIRILFYFPSVILSFLGPIFLTRYLKLQKKAQFFSSLIYALNTYFLLLVDGGQVGVALAYGFFPFALLSLKKLIDKPGTKNLYSSIFLAFVLTTIDPRISAVLLFTIFLWLIIEKKLGSLKWLLLLTLALLGLNSYWLIPILKLGGDEIGLLSISPVKIKNSLLLFQPHWPLNEFGKIFSPSIYFLGIPLLIFGSLLFKNKKNTIKFLVLFLIFAFLSKGGSSPFGGIYNFLVTKVPLGTAFRDSSKFFVPTILFASILIGKTVERIKVKPIIIGIYLYLLFLILPALLGNLNFVLSKGDHSKDLLVIKEKLLHDNSFYRSLWFPEKHPLTFQIEEKPAINAKSLIDFRPFSLMNVGTQDVFNFLRNNRFTDFFNILGIRYLVFPDDQRIMEKSDEEGMLWSNLLEVVSNNPNLKKVDWNTDIPVYELEDIKPRLYAVDKMIVVVGSDNVYEKDIDIDNVGFLFVEDGMFDSEFLKYVSKDSVSFYFNEKENKDLVLSFFKDYFISPLSAKKSDWALFSSKESLLWKYQLLVRGMSVKELNFSLAASLSTNKGEKMVYDLDVKQKGDYVLAIRSLTDSKNNALKVNFNGSDQEISYTREGAYEWFTKEVSLKDENATLTIESDNGIFSINAVSLIPKKEYEDTVALVDSYLDEFGVILENNLINTANSNTWKEVEFEKISPTRYEITSTGSSYWLIFSDRFNNEWKLKKGIEHYDSVSVYSMVNGFYIEPNWTDTEVVFKGQEEFRKGVYFTSISMLILLTTYIWKGSGKK